jgi:hypothetical protein
LAATTVSATTLTGTLSTAAQTNITSVGTLTGLTVTGGATIGTSTSTTALRNYSASNWNFSNTDFIRNAANNGTPRFLGFALDADDLASTTIGGYNAIWGVYDSAPTTGSTSAALNGGMIYGAYATHRWYVNGTERMRVAASGNVVVAGTTASTSSTTGALVVKGGAGIAGQLSVASNSTLSESGGEGTRLVLSTSGSGAIINQNDNSDVFLQTQGNTRIQIINGSGIVSFPYGITANSSGIRSTFANVITTNGVYWANGAAYSSGSASFTGGYVASQSTFGSNLVANSATTSTSNVTGAVVVSGAGGLGVGGNVYVGNRVGYVWAANSVSAVYTYFNSTTNSIDTVFGL